VLDSDDLMLVDGEGREVELVDAESGEGEVRVGGREGGRVFLFEALTAINTHIPLPPSLSPSLLPYSLTTANLRPLSSRLQWQLRRLPGGGEGGREGGREGCCQQQQW